MDNDVLTIPRPTVTITRTVTPEEYDARNPIFRFTAGNVLALLPQDFSILEPEPIAQSVKRHTIMFTIIPGKFRLWLDYNHRDERLFAEFFAGVVQLTQTHATWSGKAGSAPTRLELLTVSQQALRNKLLRACVSKAGLD